MTLEEFFKLVTPDEGVYCFGAIAGKKIEHVFLDNLSDLLDISDAVSEGVNQYYTPATFKEHGKRTQANACKVKSFWLDIDAGKGDDKSYATQEDATAAVVKAAAAKHAKATDDDAEETPRVRGKTKEADVKTVLDQWADDDE